MESRIDKTHWVLSRPAAHRGLHGEGVPENSPEAFELAAKSGYPIELDVQMTADDRLVVFHDDDLERMTGVKADVRDSDRESLRFLRLGKTDIRIPDFSEVLEVVAGRVPLLIEIKQQKREGIEKLLLNELSAYRGEFALQSFDPRIMLEIKRLAPNVIRGQLGTAKKNHRGFKTDFALKWLPLNGKVKPDFINYDLDCLPASKLVTNNLPVIAWTVRSDSDRLRAEKYAMSYVFENIRP